jgi:hypothetical protein
MPFEGTLPEKSERLPLFTGTRKGVAGDLFPAESFDECTIRLPFVAIRVGIVRLTRRKM